jgi:hypothetical protein
MSVGVHADIPELPGIRHGTDAKGINYDYKYSLILIQYIFSLLFPDILSKILTSQTMV